MSVFGTGGKTKNYISASGYAISVFGTSGKRQNHVSASGYVNVVPNRCAELATSQGPKLDSFYVPRTLCRPSSPIYESYKRSSVISRYLLRKALPHSLRHHATSRCGNCSNIFNNYFGVAYVPGASAVEEDLTASAVADISVAIADLPDAVAYTAVSP
jgi:hypothetical protein